MAEAYGLITDRPVLRYIYMYKYIYIYIATSLLFYCYSGVSFICNYTAPVKDTHMQTHRCGHTQTHTCRHTDTDRQRSTYFKIRHRLEGVSRPQRPPWIHSWVLKLLELLKWLGSLKSLGTLKILVSLNSLRKIWVIPMIWVIKVMIPVI